MHVEGPVEKMHEVPNRQQIQIGWPAASDSDTLAGP